MRICGQLKYKKGRAIRTKPRETMKLSDMEAYRSINRIKEMKGKK